MEVLLGDDILIVFLDRFELGKIFVSPYFVWTKSPQFFKIS